MTVTGTATDAGGGRVAGVEVSTDGGTSWHPATGTTVVDLHLRPARAGRPSRSRSGPPTTAPTSARSPRATSTSAAPARSSAPTVPPIAASDDGSAAELGLRFTPTVDGFVSGVRFYKGAGNGGTHTGSLWSTGGQQLATVDLHQRDRHRLAVRELLAGRSRVTAGTTYVVVLHGPAGPLRRAERGVHRRGRRRRRPLTVAGGWGATPAGVFANPGQYPANSHKNTNYFVDVMFTTVDESPLGVTNRSPLPGASSVPPGTNVRGSLQQGGRGRVAVDHGHDRGPAGRGRHVVRRRDPHDHLRPDRPAGRRHRLRRRGRRHRQPRATRSSSGGTWSFRTAKAPTTPGVCPCSLFEDTTTPTVLKADDNDAVTLGVRFAPTVDGKITAVRFYKGPDNTGTHTGHAVVGQRHVARHGHLHRRVDDGLADADLRQPGRGHQERRVRRVVPHHGRQVLLHARTVRLDRPLARTAAGGVRLGRLHLRHRLPGRDGRAPTTWSTWCSSATPRP